MSTIRTIGKPEIKIFHNEPVNVYPTTLPLDKIHFWKENNRTLFSFETLRSNTRKELDELSIEEITSFIAGQAVHKLSALAKSIERNGVQVPLIIRNDGKLLDGNRRYFACQWLKMRYEKLNHDIPSVLKKIPVLVIKKNDISHEVELKILAEANFIPDLKVPWPLDAQARAVDDYYSYILKTKKITHDVAIKEVTSTFGITKSRAIDLLDTLDLTNKFINTKRSEKEKMRLKGIIEERFVYFWEFRNKAMKGRSRYTNPNELKEVTNLFFKLMSMGQDSPVKNVKQIEPLAQSRRDRTAWAMLTESEGQKLPIIVSMMLEKKEVRKAEDKIRLFHAWLLETDELSSTAITYLKKLNTLINKKI